MRLSIYDTEHLGDIAEDYKEATGSQCIIYDATWSKSKGLAHGSPESLMAAMADAEANKEVFALFVDSATDVAHFHRVQWMKKNPGKDPKYHVLDAPVKSLGYALKSFTKHWVLTFKEKNDQEGDTVRGKIPKAAAEIEYIAKVKCECVRIKDKGKTVHQIDISDQRNMNGKCFRMVDPNSVQLAAELDLARYRLRPDLRLHAHFYGRETSGKTNTSIRLLMALQRVLQTKEGEAA